MLAQALLLPARAQAQYISLAQDLRASAREAAAVRVPLLVFFSLDGCPFCEVARRDYLEPMAADPASRKQLRMVEVEVGARASITDFSGRRVSPTAFAQAQGVQTTPTVLFLGPRGETLAPPLVGLTVADFYQSYLEHRIESALTRLRAP